MIEAKRWTTNIGKQLVNSCRPPGRHPVEPITPPHIPRSSELRTHSQTEPYLAHEPKHCITDKTKQRQFLDCIFPSSGSSFRQLELGGEKYDPENPRHAEEVVTSKLNNAISPGSNCK